MSTFTKFKEYLYQKFVNDRTKQRLLNTKRFEIIKSNDATVIVFRTYNKNLDRKIITITYFKIFLNRVMKVLNEALQSTDRLCTNRYSL